MKIQLITLICVGVAFASFFLGIAYGQTLMRREAVLGGFAEYLSDTQGCPQFTWK